MGFFSKKNQGLQSWQVFLFLGIILVAMVLGLVQRFSRTAEIEENIEQEVLNEITCSASGGVWNTCGSACRGENLAGCIALCVEMCECENDQQCPFGYSCTDVIEGIGICTN